MLTVPTDAYACSPSAATSAPTQRSWAPAEVALPAMAATEDADAGGALGAVRSVGISRASAREGSALTTTSASKDRRGSEVRSESLTTTTRACGVAGEGALS